MEIMKSLKFQYVEGKEHGLVILIIFFFAIELYNTNNSLGKIARMGNNAKNITCKGIQ